MLTRLPSRLLADKVTPEERGTLWAHMSEFDFPEELSTYEAMAAAEGLSCECVHAAPAVRMLRAFPVTQALQMLAPAAR